MPKPIVLKRKITVEDSPEAATRKAIEYLRKIGFKADASDLAFVRGSRLGALTSLSPKTMPTVAKLEADSDSWGTYLTIEFTLNPPIGTIVTEPELAFWEGELDNLEKLLRGQWVDPDADTKAEQDTRSRLWKWMVGLVVTASIGGIIAGVFPILSRSLSKSTGLSPLLVSVLLLVILVAGSRLWRRS